MNWQKRILKYIEKRGYPSDFTNESVIVAKNDSVILNVVTYKEKTFFYFFFVNDKKEEKLLVLVPNYPKRYRTTLSDTSIRNSVRWIRKNYNFMCKGGNILNEKILTLLISDDEVLTVELTENFFEIYKNQQLEDSYPVNNTGLDNLIHILRGEISQMIDNRK